MSLDSQRQMDARRQRLQYFLSRLGRLKSQANALAEPYDALRDVINFLEGSIGEYIMDLQKEIEAKTIEVQELMQQRDDLKKKLEETEKELNKHKPVKPKEEEAHPAAAPPKPT